jgi:hypothetical protein
MFWKMESGPPTIHRLKEINPYGNTKKSQAGVSCVASARRNEKPFPRCRRVSRGLAIPGHDAMVSDACMGVARMVRISHKTTVLLDKFSSLLFLRGKGAKHDHGSSRWFQ